MITPFWIHIIHNILIMDANIFSRFEQNSIYKDLLIALQLAHNTNATHITYDNNSCLWSIRNIALNHLCSLPQCRPSSHCECRYIGDSNH
jgi:hypothetical protein